MKQLMRKIMLTCEKSTLLIVKEQEGKITFREKLQLRMHLLACRFCRLFKKQNAFIASNIENLHQHPELCIPSKMDDFRKGSIEKALHAELEKGSQNN